MSKKAKRADPGRVVVFEVEGRTTDEIMAEAMYQASRFLGRPMEELQVISAGTATVASRNRFVQHLGVPAEPMTWKQMITVGVAPETILQPLRIVPKEDP